jgi:hypothetical protein
VGATRVFKNFGKKFFKLSQDKNLAIEAFKEVIS